MPYLAIVGDVLSGPSNIKTESADYGGHATTLLQEIPQFSAENIALVALPIVLISIGFAAFIGSITERFHLVRRQKLVHSICYVMGFQMTVISIAVTFGVGAELLFTEFDTDLDDYGYAIDLAIPVVAYVFFPVLILWATTILFFVFTRPRLSIVFRKPLIAIFKFILSFLIVIHVLVGATFASVYPVLFEEVDQKKLIHVWHVKSVNIKGNVIEARILFESFRDVPYRVLKDGITMDVTKNSLGFSTEKIFEIPLTLVGWSDQGQPVLEIANNDTKWAIVEGVLDERSRRILVEASRYDYDLVFRFRGFEASDSIYVYEDWNPP